MSFENNITENTVENVPKKLCGVCEEEVLEDAELTCKHFLCEECVEGMCTTACPMCRFSPIQNSFITKEVLENIENKHKQQVRDIARDFPFAEDEGNEEEGNEEEGNEEEEEEEDEEGVLFPPGFERKDILVNFRSYIRLTNQYQIGTIQRVNMLMEFFTYMRHAEVTKFIKRNDVLLNTVVMKINEIKSDPNFGNMFTEVCDGLISELC